MPIAFEDLLSTLCSEFEAQHATDFQKTYLIADAREAKLTFDVLITGGFEAKLYPDPAKGAKLYITLPTTDDAPLQQKWAAVMAYARTLSGITDTLDAMCDDEAAALPSVDYSITFANVPPQNKQINIMLMSQAAQPAASSTLTPPPAARAAAAAQPVVRKKLKKKKKKQDDGFNSGPALGKHYYPASLGDKAQNEQNSLKRQLFLYVTGNIATGSYAVLAVIIAVAILFTFFMLAKGFLCPDFATAKIKQNHAWYCGDQNDQ